MISVAELMRILERPLSSRRKNAPENDAAAPCRTAEMTSAPGGAAKSLKVLIGMGLLSILLNLPAPSPCLSASSAAKSEKTFEVNAGSFKIVDDAGRTILLSQSARRIIPLYGAFSEMLFSIGAGDSVIARTQADKFPPELARLPSVGTHMRPDIEIILGLKPDLVIVSASRKDDSPVLARLSERGIPIAVFNPRSFDDICSVINRLGVLCGREKEALAATDGLMQRLAAVRAKIKDEKVQKMVFFEIRAEPLTGAGASSIVSEIIRAAGGENILQNDKAIVRYSLENLLSQEPDYYLVQSGPMNKSPSVPGKRAHFDRLKSVREGRVLFVDELIFSRPGPRCVEAVELLAAALYPEKFK